jgi:hypothetical protein
LCCLKTKHIISLSAYPFFQLTNPRNVLFCSVAQPVTTATVYAVVCPTWRDTTQAVGYFTIRASPPRRSYFINVEHVFDYFWVFIPVENGSNVNRISFHKSLRDPHRGRPRTICTAHTRVQRCFIDKSRRDVVCGTPHNVSMWLVHTALVCIRRMSRESVVE